MKTRQKLFQKKQILLQILLQITLIAFIGCKTSEEHKLINVMLEDDTIVSEVVKEYLQKCKEGDSLSCALVGSYFEKGEKGLAKDLSKAETLYQMACRNTKHEGCEHLGDLYKKGAPNFPKNLQKSAEFYLKALEDGSNHHIYKKLIDIFQENSANNFSPEVFIKSFDIFQKSCAKKRATCDTLAPFYAKGVGGVSQNVPKAMELYRRSCVSLKGTITAGACYHLGKLYEKSPGIPNYVEKAFYYYLRSCNGLASPLTEYKSCYRLGTILEKEKKNPKPFQIKVEKSIASIYEGNAPDTPVTSSFYVSKLPIKNSDTILSFQETATLFYHLACHGRTHDNGRYAVMEACHRLGELYQKEYQDIKQAKTFYQKACKESYQPACKSLEKLSQ